ncbi:single-stranded DNA-binding protein [Kribbella sp. NPDC049174]|uniref:single-stranded DNA-binding protein n=1 Tax=Kribbella sp. NPDC049174 TaxID=3364112 RepID=UPI00371CBB0C
MTMLHTFVGNVTHDPEIRTTKTEKVVAEVKIAVTERWRDEKGQWQDKPTVFWPVQAWHETARAIGEQVRVGSKVIVVGEIEYQTWPDPETKETRSRRYIRAVHIGLTLGSQPRSHTAPRETPPETAEPSWADA